MLLLNSGQSRSIPMTLRRRDGIQLVSSKRQRSGFYPTPDAEFHRRGHGVLFQR